jgi:hypothetical protein
MGAGVLPIVGWSKYYRETFNEIKDLPTVGVNKYFPAWKVLDCVDATEYAALVDAAKDGLRIILSVGILYLGTGSKQLVNLQAIFPSGVTRTALNALVA